MTTDPARGYLPPDPTLIEDKPEALRYWEEGAWHRRRGLSGVFLSKALVLP
jgi:hypothetical protein